MLHITPSILFLMLVASATLFTASSPTAAALHQTELDARYKHVAIGGDDPRFALQPLISGLAGPTAFAFLPDGGILVAEKSGLVRVIRDGKLLDTPLLDLRPIVNSSPERGLTSLAVDPDFAHNGFVYLSYAFDPPNAIQDTLEARSYHIARYTFIDAGIVLESKVVLLETAPISHRGHSAGALRFAPDGALFTAIGDGVNATQFTENPQNLDHLYGKILRMDRNGTGLPDNPFFDPNAPRSPRSLVWAYGIRQAFRFAIHPYTGVPYFGNVGYSHHESISHATPGANFGWPCLDGPREHRHARFSSLCRTLDRTHITRYDIHYPHNYSKAAVIGGDFNFGDALPADTHGNFFFADFVRGWVRRAEVDADGRLTRVSPVLKSAGNVVDLQFGADGMLYVLSFGRGSLSRITASSAAAAAPSPDPVP